MKHPDETDCRESDLILGEVTLEIYPGETHQINWEKETAVLRSDCHRIRLVVPEY